MAESWVRVESMSEVRAGMTLQIRGCYCGVTHSPVLVLCVDDDCDQADDPEEQCGCNSPIGFELVGVCTDGDQNDDGILDCFCEDIRQGRLYRFVLDEPAAEETERTRERERTR